MFALHWQLLSVLSKCMHALESPAESELLGLVPNHLVKLYCIYMPSLQSNVEITRVSLNSRSRVKLHYSVCGAVAPRLHHYLN